ncbi:Di-copper centre-containing protein [Ascobolus immersus RN42]|uniref:tyrosinase n=1 Tax=Ascobolus immersus RN42 TaxID=1160509 RepID=A0A3N4HYC1_ASCIM|nr:Di-copper centre-containing protein [Ascobolus immersus RN42]
MAKNSTLTAHASSSAPPNQKGRASGCPFSAGLQQLRANSSEGLHIVPVEPAQQSLPPPDPPTWEGEIQYQFSAPYWIKDEEKRKRTGVWWQKKMLEYSADALDLFDYGSVKAQAKTIYDHLRSRSMPLTKDSSYYFPDVALEAFRLWANAGFPRKVGDPVEPKEIIPDPSRNPARIYRMRKDLLDLTPEEIQQFRAALDDVLKVGELDSKWQELGHLHADWCLHYQEATFFWHRAYLLYVEELIGMPIPYWNGFAEEASKTEPQFDKFVGIPPIFLEETYIHPNGEVRKNPLKYALARDGKSKDPEGGKYVSRFEVLTKPELRGTKEWNDKIKLFEKYQQQVAKALSMKTFSLPMNFDQNLPFGMPWANLPAFSDDQKDILYPDIVKQTFDGIFEQPHDNYHGWIGIDMADNSYTALDPLFLVMHCNLDRILASYLQTHPEITLTSNFPLRPFVDNSKSLEYDENREYLFTTIGDMARNTKALGYMYGPSKLTDRVPLLLTLGPSNTGSHCQQKETCPNTARWGVKSEAQASPSDTPAYNPRVIFPNLKCTTESYRICVFAENSASFDSTPTNPGFIGELVRLGMGPAGSYKNPARCTRNPDGIIRELVVPQGAVELLQDCEARLKVLVTEIGSGKDVSEEEQELIGGFKAYPVGLPRK